MAQQRSPLSPMYKVHGMYPVYNAMQSNFALDKIPESMAYILDGEGWKLLKRTGVMVSIIKTSLSEADEEIPTMPSEIIFTGNKIPLPLIKKVIAFFTKVWEKNETEAIGWLYYKVETGEWNFIPPVQTATKGSADYGEPTHIEGWLFAGTIHSHGKLTAFHSKVDDKDEINFDGVHITIGKVDQVTPEFSCSIMSQGIRKDYSPSFLIQDMIEDTEFPDEWMSKVKLNPPRELIKDKLLGEKTEKLYQQYYDSIITEEEYLKELELLEEVSGKGKSKSVSSSSYKYRGKGNGYDYGDDFPGFGGILSVNNRWGDR